MVAGAWVEDEVTYSLGGVFGGFLGVLGTRADVKTTRVRIVDRDFVNG